MGSNPTGVFLRHQLRAMVANFFGKFQSKHLTVYLEYIQYSHGERKRNPWNRANDARGNHNQA